MKNKNNDKNQELKEELVEEAEKEKLTLEADEEIEELDKESKDDTQVNDLENLLKRALADYQNLERRTEENKREWIMSSNKNLILRLLPGLDNLLLADKHSQDQGVKIAIKHFLDILEQEGVKRIKTENVDFDPNLMEAVTTAPGAEGKVVEEIKAGYTLNGEVIRPAQVIVGKQAN